MLDKKAKSLLSSHVKLFLIMITRNHVYAPFLSRPAPVAHSVRLWLETQRYWVRIPAVSDVCHEVVHIQPQTVQRPTCPQNLRNCLYLAKQNALSPKADFTMF